MRRISFQQSCGCRSGELQVQALPQRPNQLVLSVQLGEQLSLKIAPCPLRTAPARPEPGPRLWKSEPRQSKELGELRSLTPGLAQVPSPRPCLQAQRCLHSCREGWQVRGPRRRRGHPGREPAAQPPERSSGPPCPFWGLLLARSARTRFAAEVRPGRPRACSLLFPGTCWGLFLLPHPRSAAGGEVGETPGNCIGLWTRVRCSLHTYL